MKTLKVMSIIGIVWSSLCFLFIATFAESDPTASIGWGVFLFLYSLPLSIVVLVQASKNIRKSNNSTN